MKIEIKIPSMGESISEATVGTILKPTGSQVKTNDELLELETDKVNQVLYAQGEGTITLNIKEGDVVKIGQIIGSIDDTGAKSTTPPKQKEAIDKKTPSKKTEEEKKEAPPPLKQKKEEQEKQARISKEEYISEILSEKTKQTPIEIPTPSESIKTVSGERKETRQKMSKIRQVIAKRMLEAQHTTAMLTTFNEVDMSVIITMREKYKESFVKKYGVKLGFMSFFVEATVKALKQFPEINSYIDGNEIVHREYYDIGVAVGTDRGVIVPVIRNCDALSFAAIEQAIEKFAKQAREGSLSANDLQGGGFTITNGGIYGSLLSTPILNLPQSGILGMHNIVKRPIVVNDQIVIRPMMYLALSYDHRIVDGKGAVSFLVTLKNALEDPSRLLLDL